ncbi:uncharacterized protein NECHADRAFT_87492 [Fusarium vanettenii 77-13-4]|uniref:Uncharacterized protein n=1 Tax=Fusarium vanettenii (strain ATCC MYA-4622 / CBS 123669 / FGSC 9596 / NRRL 45880 / 77-13-4) TaxID=660122 RepID=C7ZEH1_FUSV7|nr:uncharacterized protein NECHADRAFT_87492 [Fusarium vanettenii 77-13-4]EEU37696.1 predicted protein [Fusarium vanettenii 77-13-4]
MFPTFSQLLRVDQMSVLWLNYFIKKPGLNCNKDDVASYSPALDGLTEPEDRTVTKNSGSTVNLSSATSSNAKSGQSFLRRPCPHPGKQYGGGIHSISETQKFQCQHLEVSSGHNISILEQKPEMSGYSAEITHGSPWSTKSHVAAVTCPTSE